ncbi:eukaryotic translation initiation factor 3 subunit J-A-like isoform X2 [Carassius auratus]|uniref:Eukaryotic translation initiation factor 3 subunit J n=1 Tax=Carassius auratus TaxID=7957 RepID=A0A6P6MEV8_CARAU|nr:eukaryotic translation initiation factor 3 subunit J-A-like isoform X2 [Carassius auratus]XP_052399499.1 eukaryotic translation initiation factor 3 subunit J-A isoform X2 [Carassius gibelio]
MADADSWDADSFELEEPLKKAAVRDKWEGEDEDDDVKDNWDDDEEEEKDEEKKSETKPTEKKKLSEKIKEKENLQRKKQEELQKRLEESKNSTELTPEEELAEKLRVKKLQEDSDLELAKEVFGVVSNNVSGIDAMSPSTKEDFTEFERLLKEKISSCEKSIHYSSFLESLFRDLCLSLEVDDLKKINNSLTVLLSEKQRQEKANKGKKKKKGVLPGGGLKATKRDDLADYGEFGGGYAQDYEDFM